jgi:hypothetical protein
MASLLRFDLNQEGLLLFEPSELLTERLRRRHEAAASMLQTLSASGVGITGDLASLSFHPAAHGLVAFRQGYLSRQKAEDCVALLSSLDSTRLERLQEDIPTVHQCDALLPTLETRGETVSLDSRASGRPDALDEMLSEVWKIGGDGLVRLAAIVRVVSLVVVKGMPDLPYFSGSTSDTWGAMHMSMPASPVVLAESLTHEAAHFWLHLVEEVGEFAPGAWDENEWISPWREDPRPIGGIIHGVHVFSSAALVISQWLQEGARLPAGVGREDIEARAAYLVAQVEEGIEELSRHPGLSETALAIAGGSEARLEPLRLRIGVDALSRARIRASERRVAKICTLQQKGMSFRH